MTITKHAIFSRPTAESIWNLLGQREVESVVLDRWRLCPPSPLFALQMAVLAKARPNLEFVSETSDVLAFWHNLEKGPGLFLIQDKSGRKEVKEGAFRGHWYIARDRLCPEQRVFLQDGLWTREEMPPGSEKEREEKRDVLAQQNIAISCAHSTLSRQEGGNHYQHFAIQPAEFIRKNKLSFTAGNVIKYVCRAPFKDGVKDLKKAQHYLEMVIEDMEEEA